MVSCPRNPSGWSPVLYRHRYVVCGGYLCWDVHSQATLPCRLRNWRNLHDIPVNANYLFLHCNWDWRSQFDSLLGTPDEENWPGVTALPDYKATFPQWKRSRTTLVPGLESAGSDLLESLLQYDPAKRLSAKQACLHPYFRKGSSYYSGRARRGRA